MSDFSLQSETIPTAKLEVKRCCKTCFWFKPNVNPETGRVRPSLKGECLWRPEWPNAWPEAFKERNPFSGIAEDPRMPSPRGIWDNRGEECATWRGK